MTEAEANMTRCCGPEGCGGNSAGEPERYCLASHCMGWRWDKDEPTLRVKNAGGQTVLVTAEAYTREWMGFDFTADPPHGFCGLAGTP